MLLVIMQDFISCLDTFIAKLITDNLWALLIQDMNKHH